MMLKTDKIEIVAKQLRQAAASGKPCAPVRSLLPDGDIEMAYKVQAINAQHGRDSGRRVCGYKIGLTSPVVQQQLGVNQPDFGVLFADMCVADSGEIPLNAVLQPKVEVEVALVLERDLDMEMPTVTDLIRATAFVLPAIEVVGSRVQNWDISIVDTIADNASSGLYVLGNSPKKLDGLDLSLCGMTLRRAGEPVSTGVGRACLGHPLSAAAWLARTLVKLGEPLLAGDVLLTGALGPMVNVNPGDRFEARVSGLGSVSVGFAAA
ncbi:2-keto-4-pentenoate hydratase [uncultured Microbulbifer sp.]|uniref:2-keto-4-pentenoate hydratase n=1 Tax=uncultured Microbulbifer sp. TaxID=348147 RepID=UPI002607D7A5|nr:2-keto-4-pentenoate hydratase [uncultured Microbulbifer sp.]